MIRYTIRNTPDEVSLQQGVKELHPNPFKAALRRLAAYEDTDLTPEQVEALQEENVRLTTPDTVRINRLERIAKQADEHGGIDHLVGLDVLAYMGRLVILPCKITEPIWLIESVYNGKKRVGEKIALARIDHFTIGEKGVPVIDACTEAGQWYTSLELGDYYLTPEQAQAAIAAEAST